MCRSCMPMRCISVCRSIIVCWALVARASQMRHRHWLPSVVYIMRGQRGKIKGGFLAEGGTFTADRPSSFARGCDAQRLRRGSLWILKIPIRCWRSSFVFSNRSSGRGPRIYWLWILIVTIGGNCSWLRYITDVVVCCELRLSNFI